jgi:HEAT repeat protein
MKRSSLLVATLLFLSGPGAPAAEPLFDGHPLDYWIGLLKAESRDTRSHAASRFAWIGPEAKAAVPALIEALGDEHPVPTDAARSLAAIGPAGVPQILGALKHPKPRVRAYAAYALELMEPKGPAEAVPVLAQTLWDPVLEVRFAAAQAIMRIDPKSTHRTKAVAVLAEAIKDKDHSREAVWAVKQIGPPAEAALPALVPLLWDDNREARDPSSPLARPPRPI